MKKKEPFWEKILNASKTVAGITAVLALMLTAAPFSIMFQSKETTKNSIIGVTLAAIVFAFTDASLLLLTSLLIVFLLRNYIWRVITYQGHEPSAIKCIQHLKALGNETSYYKNRAKLEYIHAKAYMHGSEINIETQSAVKTREEPIGIKQKIRFALFSSPATIDEINECHSLWQPHQNAIDERYARMYKKPQKLKHG